MNDLWITGPPADVKLDLSRLHGEPLGTSTRYSLGLDGAPGDEWVAEFRGRQAETPVHRRYEIDASRATVRFSCRTVDGNGMVFEFLENLEALVEEINRIVAVRHSVGPRIGPASFASRAR